MRLALPLSVMLLGTLVACSPQVHYDYDLRANYTQYRSFDWAATPEDTFTERRIRAAVEQELNTKGLRRSEAPPDLLVNAYPVYRDQRVTSTGVGVGIGLRILPGLSLGVGTGSAKARVQSIGRIVIEIKDTRSSQLIWKAEAEDVLTGEPSPEESEEAIRRAVARMLERFPPKAQAER